MAAGLYDITNEILGKGHFAIVKLAKHCLTGEHVAVKIIDKSKLNKEGLDQLSSEIRLWSILSEHEHPNVVKLYQCIDTRTKLYLVMEYCGGQVCDLYDHIQKRNDGNGLEEKEAKHIFRQICNAILYCHSLKIVHRDVKPENILIISNQHNSSNASGQSMVTCPVVKLIDFGFSNQWVEDELLRTSCGSLAYSAPEILLGNQYHGPKVDIWSLGCILYILLYGCNPFMQFNDNETLIKILDCSFTTPEKPSVSESSIDLIRGLLKKDPNTRLTIEQIMNHPWLRSDEVTNAETPSPLLPLNNAKIAQMPVHEHIIDQMIDQGIALPKEIIKKILKNEQSHLVESDQHKQGTDDTEKSSLNDHHYIKATYHLLKDKSLREFKGLDQNYRFNHYNKRGNILKKPNYNNLRRLNFGKPEKQNTQCLDVPHNNNSLSSFALPLARKCSIVSEEGSVCAESNQSEPISSNCIDRTASTEQQQQPTTMVNNNNQPAVDIVVTYTPTPECKEPRASSPMTITESISDFTLNTTTTSDKVCGSVSKLSDKLNSGGGVGHHETVGGVLHPVSSSPDFLNTDSLKSDDDSQHFQHLKTNHCDLDLGAKDDSFDVVELGGMSLYHRYREYANLKKVTNVRLGKSSGVVASSNSSVNSKTPSVRVIIQSKSLNNIALVEQQQQQSQPDVKMATSMSTVNMKQTKNEKTDCCTVC